MAGIQLGAGRLAKYASRGMLGKTSLRLPIRDFSATCAARIKTTAMEENDFKSIKVDQGRLMDTLHYTCGFGTGLRWGRQA